jgi:hypothetical protein
MIEDMTVRNMSPATQRSYISAVSKFSRYFGRSPDRLTLNDVHAFQVHLVSTGISWPGLNRMQCQKRSEPQSESDKGYYHTLLCAGRFGRGRSGHDARRALMISLKTFLGGGIGFARQVSTLSGHSRSRRWTSQYPIAQRPTVPRRSVSEGDSWNRAL